MTTFPTSTSSPVLLAKLIALRQEAELVKLVRRRDFEDWRTAWRAREREDGRWRAWTRRTLGDLRRALPSPEDLAQLGPIYRAGPDKKKNSTPSEGDKKNPTPLPEAALAPIASPALQPPVEAEHSARVAQLANDIMMGVQVVQMAKGATAAYISAAGATSVVSGQHTLNALGLNKTFAWADRRAMPNAIYAVRGSKVVQGMYGTHINKLAEIVARATDPARPLAPGQVVKEISQNWNNLTKYQAERIARTETAAVWETTNLNTMLANGVTSFESLIATGPSIGVESSPVCPYCVEYAADAPYEPANLVEFPPLHPSCRCTLIPAEDFLPPQEPWAGEDVPMSEDGGLDGGLLQARSDFDTGDFPLSEADRAQILDDLAPPVSNLPVQPLLGDVVKPDALIKPKESLHEGDMVAIQVKDEWRLGRLEGEVGGLQQVRLGENEVFLRPENKLRVLSAPKVTPEIPVKSIPEIPVKPKLEGKPKTPKLEGTSTTSVKPSADHVTGDLIAPSNLSGQAIEQYATQMQSLKFWLDEKGTEVGPVKNLIGKTITSRLEGDIRFKSLSEAPQITKLPITSFSAGDTVYLNELGGEVKIISIGDSGAVVQSGRSLLDVPLSYTAHTKSQFEIPEVAFGKTRAEKVVGGLVETWAESSGDSSPWSLALQRATKEEFGVAELSTAHLRSMLETDAIYEAHGPALRAFVRAMYDQTQEELHAAGITELTLYRGYAAPTDVLEGRGLAETSVVLQPASSFSSTFELAQSFAATSEETALSVVLGVKVPASRVLSTARTGWGCLAEREFVVLGAKDGGRDALWAMKAEGATNEREFWQTVRSESPEAPADLGGLSHAPEARSIAPEPISSHPSTVPLDLSALPEQTALQVERTWGAIETAGSPLSIGEVRITSLPDPIDPYLKTTVSKGRYVPSSFRENPNTIQIRPSGETPELTFAHEYGHMVDYELMGTTRGESAAARAWKIRASSEHRAMSDWIRAVKNSDAYKTLTESGEAYNEYLLKPHELWARSYAQWVATRSREGRMIEQVRGMNPEHAVFHSQWTARDFEPIGKAMDELFAKLKTESTGGRDLVTSPSEHVSQAVVRVLARARVKSSGR